jgi:methionyl-tRNA formyltransferase
MSRLKIILAGYHWTGCRVLEHLLTCADVSDLAVFSHPSPEHVPDVCALAQKHDVRVSTDDISTSSLPFKPDVIASVYYRNIIRPNVIEACGRRIFNLHPSLLPRHRGCSSVPWAMIEGDTVTGITYHYIDQGIDTGPVLLQAAVPILPDDTQATLFDRCMKTGVDFFPAAFELVKAGFPGVAQQGAGSYHPRGAPFGGQIDPSWDEPRVERFIRAMTYPPYPDAQMAGRPVKSMEEYRRLRESR